MAKKCTKKCDARVKFLFCQSKPIAFLPFSLRLPLSFHSLLFLPTALLFLGSCPPSSRLEGLGVDGFPVLWSFFMCWFSNCWPYKHLLYTFLAWLPFPFLSVLIYVVLLIALSLHKFLLFPRVSSFLLFLPGRKLISVLSFQGSQ